MGILAKTCGLVTALAALNWVALGFLQTDAMRHFAGDGRSPVTDGVNGAVAACTLFLLFAIVRKKK